MELLAGVRIVKLFRVKLEADFLQAMAYLRMDKNDNFDKDWAKEMEIVSNSLADQDYCQTRTTRPRPRTISPWSWCDT